MTIPIIKHGNLILYNTVYSSKPAKIVRVFSKSTALYTCQKLTKHFQPELFDNSVYVSISISLRCGKQEPGKSYPPITFM